MIAGLALSSSNMLSIESGGMVRAKWSSVPIIGGIVVGDITDLILFLIGDGIAITSSLGMLHREGFRMSIRKDVIGSLPMAEMCGWSCGRTIGFKIGCHKEGVFNDREVCSDVIGIIE